MCGLRTPIVRCHLPAGCLYPHERTADCCPVMALVRYEGQHASEGGGLSVCVCDVVCMSCAENKIGAEGATGLGHGLGSMEGVRDLTLDLMGTCV